MAVVYSDNFNRANESPIAAPWATANGNCQLSSNKAYPAAANAIFRYDGTGATQTDCYAVLTPVVMNYGGIYLLLRWDGNVTTNAPSNCYAAQISGTGSIFLRKYVNGSPTTIGTATSQPTTGTHTLMIQAVGTTIKVALDGTQIISVTDSAYSSGKTGVYFTSGGNIARYAFDDFEYGSGGLIGVPPGAPSGTSAAYNSATDANVITFGTATGATTYNVYYGTSANPTTLLASGLSGTTYSHANPASVDLHYRVTATNSSGEGGYSPDVQAITPRLATPLNVAAAYSAPNTTVTWSAVANAYRYDVYSGASPSSLSLLASDINATTYAHANPSAGVTYYAVKAKLARSLDVGKQSAVALGYNGDLSTLTAGIRGAYQVDATHTDVIGWSAFGTGANTAGNWAVSGATVSAAAVQTDTKIVRLTHDALTKADRTVTANASVVASGGPTSAVYRSNIVADAGDSLAPMGIIWRNVATAGDYLYIATFTADYKARVQRLQISTGTWTSTTLTLSSGTDGHQTPNIVIDPTDNKPVVIVGGTSSNLAYGRLWKAATAYGIDFGAPSNLPTPAAGASIYCIPTFAADGTLVVLASHVGGGGNGQPTYHSWHMYRYAGDSTPKTAAQLVGGSWTEMLRPHAGASDYPTPYATLPAIRSISGTERIGLGFSYYRPVAGTTYTDLTAADVGFGYLYTDDKGVTWRKVDGTAVTLPVTFDSTLTDSTLWAYKGSAIRGAAVALLSDGSPVAIVRTSLITAGTSNVKIDAEGAAIVRYNAGWSLTTLSEPIRDVSSMVGNSASCIVVGDTDGTAYVLGNQQTTDDGGYPSARLLATVTSDLTTWNAATMPYPDGARKWNHGQPHAVVVDGTVHAFWNRTDLGLGNTAAGSVLYDTITAVSAPTDCAATVNGNAIDVSWTNAEANPTSTLLQRSVNGGAFAAYQTLGNVSTYTDTSVSVGNTYAYRVASVNAFGTSAYSAASNTASLGIHKRRRSVFGGIGQTLGR